jgi:hypothetical protein
VKDCLQGIYLRIESLIYCNIICRPIKNDNIGCIGRAGLYRTPNSTQINYLDAFIKYCKHVFLIIDPRYPRTTYITHRERPFTTTIKNHRHVRKRTGANSPNVGDRDQLFNKTLGILPAPLARRTEQNVRGTRARLVLSLAGNITPKSRDTFAETQPNRTSSYPNYSTCVIRATF